MAVVKVQDRSKGEWTRTIRQNNTTAKIRPLFEKWRNYGRRTEKRGDERSLPERGSTELGDARGPNYEIDVPIRGMDDWALWSFLENTFGENGGFNVVQRRDKLRISTPAPLNPTVVLGRCMF